MADLQAGAALVLDSIAQRLATMESRPRSWGGPEALELQFLGLVEVRQMLLRPEALTKNPHETRHAYFWTYVGLINGSPYACSLGSLLRDADRLDELPGLLGDFGRWMEREYPPEAT